MTRLSVASDGSLTVPKSLLGDATEVLFLEGAEAIVIKKVRRSVAEKSFEEVARPHRQMAQDLDLRPEDVTSLVDDVPSSESLP